MNEMAKVKDIESKIYNIRGKLVLYEGLFIDKYIIPMMFRI